MEKVIAAFDARRQFGTVIRDVVANGDRFVVERHGDPVAALGPIEVYEQWKQQRQTFFDQLRQAASRADLPEQEASGDAEYIVSGDPDRPEATATIRDIGPGTEPPAGGGQRPGGYPAAGVGAGPDACYLNWARRWRRTVMLHPDCRYYCVVCLDATIYRS